MLIATQSAVYRVANPEDPEAVGVCLGADGVRCVAEGAAGAIVAMSEGTIRVLSDAGSRAVDSGIDEPIECLLILDEHPLELLIGTEGAHLFHLRGAEISRIRRFDALDCRAGWHTPWGGPPSVRSLAATADGWVYADIHVGSIMRSGDGGQSWEPVTPDLNEDVHQVATCRARPDRVYANTARGVYVSEDRGQSWHDRARDLGRRYGRAIAVAPDDPDLLLATISDGPHGGDVHGQLWQSEDCGRNWRHVSGGFPASTPDNINTFHVALCDGGQAWAVVGRTLYVGKVRASRWEAFWTATEPILMIAGSFGCPDRQALAGGAHSPGE